MRLVDLGAGYLFEDYVLENWEASKRLLSSIYSTSDTPVYNAACRADFHSRLHLSYELIPSNLGV